MKHATWVSIIPLNIERKLGSRRLFVLTEMGSTYTRRRTDA